ncbi:hypothetical protein BAUCODRAFT_558741 [Baudoinia panamericana UAMH 10762]|uniref:ZIP zinc/iron transport family n=1 Tax=Baudoinia panamericana (strain UAMH 10762) TaxID=717646 RepID=M2LKE4_BAUPA|nr:uncharacterized protein BAUCODRAFT_558741 [Baudoinia panamericana UAMH 10762]EMC94742.1 hypothetical protein BAUCODRAFT_558741 [Baudoinia panamericana UAMH 10762]
MSTCDTGNAYDGNIGLRISSVFVILIGGFLGAASPVYASRHKNIGVPDWAFFIAKYFGSGVIIATAFVHLLAPAADGLTDPCLTGPITEYDWAEGICLMVIFLMFFAELIAMRYAKFGAKDHRKSQCQTYEQVWSTKRNATGLGGPLHDPELGQTKSTEPYVNVDPENVTNDQLSQPPDNVCRDYGTQSAQQHPSNFDTESYAAQMTVIFILEFGIVFHSVFIGLTLAVAGSEFPTLYIVLVFHQTFEGLGLGTRLASVAWPESKPWTPYMLSVGYALSTPIGIAIGLGVRTTFAPDSQTTLIVNGVFDAISAGILIYTGLVELMAHEFMFGDQMQRAPMRQVMAAFGCMCLGAGLMALLGKWA